jgi:hypothetical protein
MRFWCMVITSVILVLTGCGGDTKRGDSDAGSPEDAVTHQLQLLSEGLAGSVYAEIHPAQQAIVSKDQFVACVSRHGFAVSDVHVLDTSDEHFTIPGTNVEVDSKVMTVRYTVRSDKGEETDTDRFHEVYVDGHWRFTLKDPDQTKRGDC